MNNVDWPTEPSPSRLSRETQPVSGQQADLTGSDREPSSSMDEINTSNDTDDADLPLAGDDAQWDAWLDVFLPDDELDPLPQPGDFWIDDQPE
jgi:hypothetical protein